jgi:hypothetical protein
MTPWALEEGCERRKKRGRIADSGQCAACWLLNGARCALRAAWCGPCTSDRQPWAVEGGGWTMDYGHLMQRARWPPAVGHLRRRPLASCSSPTPCCLVPVGCCPLAFARWLLTCLASSLDLGADGRHWPDARWAVPGAGADADADGDGDLSFLPVERRLSPAGCSQSPYAGCHFRAACCRCSCRCRCR